MLRGCTERESGGEREGELLHRGSSVRDAEKCAFWFVPVSHAGKRTAELPVPKHVFRVERKKQNHKC